MSENNNANITPINSRSNLITKQPVIEIEDNEHLNDNNNSVVHETEVNPSINEESKDHSQIVLESQQQIELAIKTSTPTPRDVEETTTSQKHDDSDINIVKQQALPHSQSENKTPVSMISQISFRALPSYSKSFKNSISSQRLSRVPQRMSRYISRDHITSPINLDQLRASSNISASYSHRVMNELQSSNSQLLHQDTIQTPTALRASYTRSSSHMSQPRSEASRTPISPLSRNTSDVVPTESMSDPSTPLDKKTMQQSQYEIPIFTRESNQKTFPSNIYTTAKYTLWNFIPYNLYEQFRRFANFVFLLMVFIQLIPGVSPFPLYTTIAPLLFILAVSAIKEAIEDLSRHRLDKRTNSREYQRVELDGTVSTIHSSDIVAGDILMLYDEEPLPCDMLLLSCADQDGLCYVDTAGLDGETNLKEKTALRSTRMFQQSDEVDSLSNIDGSFVCEAPNKNLNSFTGTLYVTEQCCLKAIHLDPTMPYNYGSNEHSSQIFSSVDMDNMLLRGSVIKNSGWIAGLVVYTGVSTKLSLNLCDSSFKFSNVEKKLNRYVYVIFILWLLMAIFSTMASIWFNSNSFIVSLGITQSQTFLGVLYDFFTFFILYSFCVPMSLYVTLEFSRWMQAFYMKNDLDFYIENEGCMRVGTSNLNDELGQIDFILSDKTGTITRNEMVYYGFSIGGILYTRDQESIDICEYLHEEVDRDIYTIFMRALCIVNTIKPIQDGENIIYRAESADEEALLSGVCRFGWGIINRTKDSVDIEEGPIYNSIDQDQYNAELEEDPGFIILQSLSFSSSRKRMSVLVKDKDNVIWLFSKGADSKILSFSPDKKLFENSYMLSQLDERQKRLLKTVDHVNTLSKDGFRLLLVGARRVPELEYKSWLDIYNKAAQSIENRDELVEVAFERIEKGMFVYGCTAVEDRLQENVQETIGDLRKGGIRVCVATGDKMETAENIAYNANIIEKNTPVYHIQCANKKSLLKKQIDAVIHHTSYMAPRSSVILSSDRLTFDSSPLPSSSSLTTGSSLEATSSSVSLESTTSHSKSISISQESTVDPKNPKTKKWTQTFSKWIKKACTSKPNARKRKMQLDKQRGKVPPYSVIIDGESIDMIIQYYPDEFEHIINSCSTLVCCRMSPKQKSKVICFARDTGNITLAIGDGANDISMIRDSNVGIGIYGKEGTGAANSADYVLRRFYHLKKLLYVHGRNCYKGIIQCILMAFWSYMVFNFPQLFYLFSSLASGQSLYSSSTLTAFMCFAVPFFASFGFFYTELDSNTLMKFPQLYRTLHCGKPLFTTGHYILILLSSFICSIFTYVIPHSHFAVDDSVLPSGLNLDIWSFGFTVFLNVILSLFVENSFRMPRFNSGVFAFFGLVILFLLLIPVVILYLMPDELYYSLFYICRSPFLWLQAIFAFGFQYIPHLLIKGWYISRSPEDWQIAAEYSHYKNSNMNSCKRFDNVTTVEEDINI